MSAEEMQRSTPTSRCLGALTDPAHCSPVHLFLLLDPDNEAKKPIRNREMSRAAVDTSVLEEADE